MPKKILIVEDEAIISEPFKIILSSGGYGVKVAGNGHEALELCKKDRYDLILLDIMMPVCNGVEFLEKAKLDTAAPTTKVIIMSNLSSGEELTEALALGAKKSILKASVTPKTLLELVAAELDEA